MGYSLLLRGVRCSVLLRAYPGSSERGISETSECCGLSLGIEDKGSPDCLLIGSLRMEDSASRSTVGSDDCTAL